MQTLVKLLAEIPEGRFVFVQSTILAPVKMGVPWFEGGRMGDVADAGGRDLLCRGAGNEGNTLIFGDHF